MRRFPFLGTLRFLPPNEHAVTSSGTNEADEAEYDIGSAPGAGFVQVLFQVTIANNTDVVQAVRFRSSATGAILKTLVVPVGGTYPWTGRMVALPNDSITRQVLTTVGSGTLYIGYETCVESAS